MLSSTRQNILTEIYRRVSGRVIQFNSFLERRQWGPYSPYKIYNHNLYIGTIIYPRIYNTIHALQLS